MDVRSEIEAKMMLTAKFFDSEGGDFERFLSDWFELTLEFPKDAADAFAKDICDTYERVLASDLENNSRI